jgi:hypothetical protein
VPRLLRYASSTHAIPLSGNASHEFAHDYAVSHFDSGAIYSMIPKNACSTLRLSLAIANGAIDGPRSWRWIHKNNQAFRPSLRELATAPYSFAVLRCPFARLVSCFLDKFVSRRPDAWQFHELIEEEVELPRLTFRRFCQEMARPRVKHSNIHWRPQVDFLVYTSYDDLFCVEDLAGAAQQLEQKIGLTIVDSRPLVRHDAGQYATLPPGKGFADTEIWQIESIMMSGLRPHPLSFYDNDLRELIAAAYVEDFKLFNCLFRGKGLFDSAEALALVG